MCKNKITKINVKITIPLMFNIQEFQAILNDTKKLFNEDLTDEEIIFKIRNNLKILTILCNKIEDKNIKHDALKTLNEIKNNDKIKLYNLIDINPISKSNSIQNVNYKEHKLSINNLIEQEMLENSIKLHNMTKKFNETLDKDKKIIDKTKQSYMRNFKESSKNTLNISTSESFNTLYYFFQTLVIVILMFLIIKII